MTTNYEPVLIAEIAALREFIYGAKIEIDFLYWNTLDFGQMYIFF